MSEFDSNTLIRSSRLTEKIAAYSKSTSFADLPDETVDCAKRVILDSLGCMVLGSTMPPGEIMRSYVRDIAKSHDATVIGGDFQTSPANAALVNGTAAHADELDASHITGGHPAGITVSAALSICESAGLAGTDLVNAVVLAHDIGGRLLTAAGGSRAIQDAHHGHSSALLAVGTSAAVGRMLSLDSVSLRYAMALTAMCIFSPVAFMEEHKHMTKALNSGQAAYASVTGGLLAAKGFEANDHIIEAEHGLMDVWWTRATDPSLTLQGLGTDYSILDTGFKYYSAGYPIHAPLWLALGLLRDNDLALDDIETIRVGMSTQSADLVDNRHMPSICIQDMLSVGLVMGGLSYEEAHDEQLTRRADVARLRNCISIVRDQEIDARSPRTRGAWVEIVAKTQTTYRAPEHLPPGNWELGGMPWADVESKFDSLVSTRLGPRTSRRIIDIAHNLESIGDLGELGSLLQQGVAGEETKSF